MMIKRIIVACALLGIALPFASLAATMSSQNYTVDFSRIGADQLFAVSDGTSEQYSLIPADNAIADQDTNTPPANTNSAKTRKDQRDVFEQAQAEVGGSIQDDNVNGSSSPPANPSPAPKNAEIPSLWWKGRTGITVIALVMSLLIVIIVEYRRKKPKDPWWQFNLR